MEEQKQEHALVRLEAGGPIVQRTEGMQVHRDSLMPPIVVLAQAQSKDGTPGKLRRTDTGDEFASIDAVPLASRVTQVKWPEGGFSRDSQPECWSNDGVRAAPAPAAYADILCATCQFYNPRPGKGESGEEKCQTGHNVVFMEAESFDPFAMRLRGTANSIINLISSKSIAAKAVVTLYSEKTTDTRGTWYQLKAKTTRPLDEADQSLAAAMVRDYKQVDLGIQESPQDAEDPEVPEIATPLAPPPARGASTVTLTLCITSPLVDFPKGPLKFVGAVENESQKTVPVVAWADIKEKTKFLGLVVGDVVIARGHMMQREVGKSIVQEFQLDAVPVKSTPINVSTSKTTTPTPKAPTPAATAEQDKEDLWGPAKDLEFPF